MNNYQFELFSYYKSTIKVRKVSSPFSRRNSRIFFCFHLRIQNMFQIFSNPERLAFLQRSISSIKFLTNPKKRISNTKKQKNVHSSNVHSSSSFLHISSNEISQFPCSLWTKEKSKSFSRTARKERKKGRKVQQWNRLDLSLVKSRGRGRTFRAGRS